MGRARSMGFGRTFHLKELGDGSALLYLDA
jgi:hypothetical protein